MKISIFPDYQEMSRAAADFVAKYVNKHPRSLLCFPSGDTPTGTLQLLVQYGLEKKVDFSQCRFVGLDEWVGMDEHTPGSCKQYMYTHFFHPLHIPKENIVFFDAKATDLAQECKRIDQSIFEHGPIDIMLVGVGLNGHIGLNEPGSSFDLYAHVRDLDAVTIETAQKYFTSETLLKQGITLGIKHLLEAKTAILIASGSKKASIIAKALEGEISNKVPASVFQIHPNGLVMLDKEAASGLTLKGN
ncbi:glucosamine-6-phosphate deaminase [Rhodocytophaga aerolata]|uniref:Glucosamine-6-phosphate deaminase n=1 Tax=Rhodocytophaga aerolata TaxID=455078 RepID=A0ABT8R995_9BACT|nr:glucosamine-6-phosphate deaminase [Rhodocytophaga aerolata]MDO1448664.1 glucosamine-6-phosphate deaminase [Rhodocytophaga aerolata]